MILSQPLIIGATLPQLVHTFGAASVILSPILNMLLFAAALYLIFYMFHMAQQNNLFRNIFATIGVLSVYNYIVDSLSSSNNRVQSPIQGYPIPFHPSSVHTHPSTQSRQSHMHVHSTVSLPSTIHTHPCTGSRHTNRIHGHSDDAYADNPSYTTNPMRDHARFFPPQTANAHEGNQPSNRHGH